MLPACRMAGDEFAIPTFELTPRDVAGFTDALQEVQGLLHACFPRSEPRAHCFDSLVGQWSALARKSIEPMALRVPGGSGRGLQRFLSAVPWDEEHRRWLSHPLVAAELGAPDGVLLVDETGFVKKGTDSGGVGRQYCGTRGQVAHGQGGGGGLCLTQRLCARGEARVPARGLVDRRVGRPTDQVAGPSRAALAEQTAVSGRHVPGDRARGAAPVHIPRGRWPLGQ
jgi:hypothetical protein